MAGKIRGKTKWRERNEDEGKQNGGKEDDGKRDGGEQDIRQKDCGKQVGGSVNQGFLPSFIIYFQYLTRGSFL